MNKQFTYINTGEVKSKAEWIRQLSIKTFDSLVKYGGMKEVKEIK